jgi:NAD(P)-dependent dehydrogenase (short-subunit alcohol dehydrogenase family)
VTIIRKMEKSMSARNLFDLAGRRALVTGASRGIGLAIAHGLGNQGAEVVITSRKADGINSAAEQLKAGGIKALPLVCHQGEPASIQALFEQIDRLGAPLDVVIVNAAANPVMGGLVDVDLGAWQKIMDVNLTGALVTAQNAARRMVPRKSGSIIFMTSIAAFDPMSAIAAYSVSKTALVGLTKALAKELGPNNIRVNAIAPGLVETKFASALFQNRQAYEQMMADVPLGRHGQPEDIVGATVFLASDASAYMTGQVLIVDGGTRR